MDKFSIREEMGGEVVVIEAPARLDASVASDFRAKMGEFVDKGKNKIVVNLAKTEFMDSSGLGALVSRIATSRANKGDIRLASPTAHTLKLLEITHLNKIFKIFDDVNSAIESFKQE